MCALVRVYVLCVLFVCFRACVFKSVCYCACLCAFVCVCACFFVFHRCVCKFVFVMFMKFFSDCASEALKLKLVITHGWRNNETSAQLRL